MTERPETRPGRARRSLALVATLALIALAGAGALVLSASVFWPGELAASFAWQLGWTSFATAAVLTALRRPRRALAAALLGAGLAGPELAPWLPAGEREPVAGEVELTVASLNLSYFNDDVAGVRGWLERHRPDVVVCTEVSPAWRAALDDGRGLYPERLISPRPEGWKERTFGLALLSRLPLLRARRIEAPYGQPLLEGVVRVAGEAGTREVTVRGGHPFYPGSPWLRSKREAVLALLGEQDWDGAGVLAGDLNTTSGSPAFRSLLRASGLRDSRRGFGRQPTYRLFGLAPLSLVIDHVLVGPDLRVLSRTTSALPGSDHRAVLVRLAVGSGVQ